MGGEINCVQQGFFRDGFIGFKSATIYIFN